MNYAGWASRLKIDYPWEAFNFGLVGYYGSGADANRTDANGLPGKAVYNPGAAPAKSDKNGSYVVPPNAETGSFNEGEVLTASYINDGYTGFNYFGNTNSMTRGSNGGIWLAKLYAAYKVTPEFKMTLQGLYYGDTTKNGDTFGNSRDASGTSLKNNSTIGYELDLINEWQVYKKPRLQVRRRRALGRKCSEVLERSLITKNRTHPGSLPPGWFTASNYLKPEKGGHWAALFLSSMRFASPAIQTPGFRPQTPDSFKIGN